jgi:uncharacterized OsmC-like protein
MTIRQNVDVDKLEEFRNFLADNPEKARLHLEAKAIYEEQAGRSTVHIGPFAVDDQKIDRATRHYTFPFGAWREVEELIGVPGATDRMEPVEMTLAAVAACLINSISFNAARLDIDTEGMEINVRTTVDPRVLFALKGPEEHGTCIGTIAYDVQVKGDVSDEELETIRDLCRYSPVYGMMSEKINLVSNLARA